MDDVVLTTHTHASMEQDEIYGPATDSSKSVDEAVIVYSVD